MKINGKDFSVMEVTFNHVCALEDMGIDLGSSGKTLSTLRAFVALALDETVEEAGTDIEKYVEEGNGLKELVSVMTESMEKSGFFALSPRKQTRGKQLCRKFPKRKRKIQKYARCHL